MPFVRKTGGKTRFYVINNLCLGCRCFQPGQYQHRGATMSGSRSTGQVTPCCLQNAYRGCPDDRGHSEELTKQRKAEGWKNV